MKKITTLSFIIIALVTTAAMGQITWTEHNIGIGIDYVNHVYAVDMDRDGDMDVLATASGVPDVVVWYENDGLQNFTQRMINGNFVGAWSACAIDIDRDNDIDVVAAAFSDDKISWFENDGQQNFTERIVATGFDLVVSAYAADLDGDNDIDILGAASSAGQIRWWENNGSQVFMERIIAAGFTGAWRVITEDVDDDGDMDVLGCSNSGNTVAWFENDGNQNFTQRPIASGFSGAQDLKPGDIDGDGDIDVAAVASSADIVAWFENDGNENFTRRDIATGYDYPRSVFIADVDHDFDMDIFAAANTANLITWFENDGNQNFTRRDIRMGYSGALSVYVDDLDSDGDMDVIGAAAGSDQLDWWESDLGPYSGLYLTVTPNNPPIVIPSGGGSFSYDVSIQNTSTGPITFNAWTMVILPNGVPYGPLLQRNGLIAPAGATIMRTLSQFVPPAAPPGNYTFEGNVLTQPDSIQATESFPFTKLTDDGGAPNHNLGWACYGWDEGEKSQITNPQSQIANLGVSPNPFNASTIISFQLRASGLAKLSVFDITGREVALLAEGYLPEGHHQAVFDAGDLSSGVYFAKLTAGDFVQTMKLLLIK